jgi:hypothetical protein
MIRRHHSDRVLVYLFAAAAGLAATATVQAASPIGTRDGQALERDLGRATGDPYWTSREEQPVPPSLERIYHSAADVLNQPAAPLPLERYGRAGGYVGRDRFEALDWTMRDQMSATRGG